MVARWQGSDRRWRRGGWHGGSRLLCLGFVTMFVHRLALPLLGRRRLEEDRRAGQLVGDVARWEAVFSYREQFNE